MIRQYAVEPEVIARSWDAFRVFVDQCGIPRGRLICEFPKQWRRRVYDALVANGECRDMERKRIEVRMRSEEFRRKLVSANRDFDPRRSWIQNAVAERKRFDAIIARARADLPDEVIADVDVDETRPEWKTETQRHIACCAWDIAECARPLVRGCRAVLLVDRDFSLDSDRFRAPLLRLLEVIGSEATGWTTVEYHTGDAERKNGRLSEEKLKREFGSALQDNSTLRFVFWRRDQMHNRFVLTERGGMTFSDGLQELPNRPWGLVSLLEESVWKREWSRYAREAEGGPLQPAGSFELSRSGRSPSSSAR
jgi:hypothetical protein